MFRALTVAAPLPAGPTLRSAASLHPDHGSSAASHRWAASPLHYQSFHQGFRGALASAGCPGPPKSKPTKPLIDMPAGISGTGVGNVRTTVPSSYTMAVLPGHA